jgi:hypothetical protein
VTERHLVLNMRITIFYFILHAFDPMLLPLPFPLLHECRSSSAPAPKKASLLDVLTKRREDLGSARFGVDSRISIFVDCLLLPSFVVETLFFFPEVCPSQSAEHQCSIVFLSLALSF